jgi:hypothetical protein
MARGSQQDHEGIDAGSSKRILANSNVFEPKKGRSATRLFLKLAHANQTSPAEMR